jgi:amidase
VTPAELIEAAIARIEALNPQLNAVIHPLFDKARAAASSADLADGPFRGVPFLVKDVVCHTAGDPYHAGTRFLKEAGWVEESDTELARRYRAAGFVFVGKTNTPEFAMSATTEPLAYGPSRNPWNLEHSTGGSSGGTGAAVAAGLAPLGHGNDMGGSIRIPAAHCGLVGLKPTRARNSLAPNFGEYWGPFTHEHVLTRSVRDTAAVLDATAGPAPGDPYLAPPPARPWAEEIGVQPGRLRIGFRSAPGPTRTIDSACVDAVENTAKLLNELGHDVEPVALEALDADGLGAGFGVIAGATLARDLERWGERLGRPITEADIEPFNWSMAEAGRAVSATAYVAAIEAVQSYARGVAAWWDEGFDLLLTPTAATQPPRIGELAPLGDPQTVMAGMTACTAFTTPFNATGQPAISLPLHWSDEGLPVGIQLVAAYGREDVLLRLASQLEEARPWSGRLPAIHA